MNRRNVCRLFVWSAIAAAVFLVGMFVTPAARADAIDATCRITVGEGVVQGVGTGCCYQIVNNTVCIITAAHVVDRHATVQCEFWRAGHQSAGLAGTVMAKSDLADIAVIAVPASAFAGRLPDVIPFAKPNYVAKQGQTVQSVGCSKGAWATQWRGHVLRYDQLGLHFVPPPANGRSGSAIFDADGKQIIGVLRARSADDTDGLATPIHVVCQALSKYGDVGSINLKAGWRADADGLQLVQCPGSCQPGTICPSYSGDDAGLRTRRQQQQAPANPWPTLPAEQAPTVPPVDLSPIEQQLADIRSAMASPQQVASVDPTAQQALGLANQANQGVQQLRQDVPRIVADQIKPIGDKVDQIGGAVGPLVKLQAQLQADAEAGGLKGKIAERILDAGDDPIGAIHKEMGIVGAVLAVGLLIVFGVFHLIRTGKGPAHNIVEKLAAKHPDSERLASLDAKLGTIDAKILAAVQPLQAQLHQVALATPPAAVIAPVAAPAANTPAATPIA